MRKALTAQPLSYALCAVWLSFVSGADAQVVSCPTNGPVYVENPPLGSCGPPISVEWSAGVCGCGANLFVVNCPVSYAGGTGPNGTACAVNCWLVPTQQQCVPVEITGTPPPPPPGAPAPPQPPPCVGRPVSLTTGEVFFTHTDGRVGEIELTRTYNTARVNSPYGGPSRSGVLGPGWNMSLDARLSVLSTSEPRAIEVRLPDGTPIYYVDKLDPGHPDVYAQELPFSKDSWIETIPSGFRRVIRRGGSETYDAAGNLQLVIDAAGRQTVYGRDAQGRLTTITRDNRTVTLIYVSTAGAPTRLDRILGPDGVTPLVVYTYESGWRLKAVDYPGVPNSGYRFYFETADFNARITRVTDAAVPPIPIEEHVYDGSGRAETSEIADGQEKLIIEYLPPVPPPPAGSAGRTRVTDARGNVTLYHWIEVDRVRRVTKVNGPCCGSGSGESREWKYDAKGRIVEYIDDSGHTTYTYDPGTGDLLAENKPLSHTTRYTYWPDGRIKTILKPNGGFTELTYVPAGPDVVTQTVDPPPAPPRVTDFDYTAEGRLEWVTDARGKRTQFTYDTRGDLVAVTDPLGTSTPDPNDHVTRFEYDDFGRRTAVVNPLGHRTETLYDAPGNVRRVRQFDGTRPIDTTFTYTPAGRRETATDPNGRITDYQYDTYGRLWKVFQPAVEGVRPVTTYGYDLMSNLTSIMDAENRTTTFVYDAYNRVQTIIYPGPREENFIFDASGRLATRTRGGVTTSYGYDALDRVTSKTFSDGTPSLSYTYDENGDLGFLTSASHGGHSLSWNYDLAGDLRSEVATSTPGPPSTVAYTYDLAGNRESVSLDGFAWLTYEYDDASRLDKIHRGATVFDFGYDDADRRTSLDFPNLAHTAYGYDTLSRLISLATTRNQAAIVSSTYTYDDAGNRLTKTHPGSYAEAYIYDPLDRLRDVTRNSTPSEQYTYDKVGNRNRPPWTYNDRNELLSNPSNTFSYDLRGNLWTKVDGPDTWTYEWTAENQLKRVLKNGAEVARYAYDALGRRIERVVGPVVYRYLYDGEDVLQENFSSPIEEEGMVDPPPHLYVHGPGIDEPLAVKHGNDVVWHYHADGLGSILGATNIDGLMSHSRTYDSFGNQQDGADEQGYAYTGREWDPETGLFYFRARYYDPKVGRFISGDPIGFDGGINFYSYVGNNPTNWTDPTGLRVLQPPDPFTTIGVCTATVLGAATTTATTVGLALLATPANMGSDFAPGEPRPPTCDKTNSCNRKNDESPCDRLLELCLENPWQPPHKVKQWGKRKDCGACYRECKNAGGAWPFDKCKIF